MRGRDLERGKNQECGFKFRCLSDTYVGEIISYMNLRVRGKFWAGDKYLGVIRIQMNLKS